MTWYDKNWQNVGSVRDNLNRVSKQYYGRNFDNLVKKFKLKQALRVLRKIALRIWKVYLIQDFTSWFERKGKELDEWLEIKIVGETAVSWAL